MRERLYFSLQQRFKHACSYSESRVLVVRQNRPRRAALHRVAPLLCTSAARDRCVPRRLNIADDLLKSSFDNSRSFEPRVDFVSQPARGKFRIERAKTSQSEIKICTSTWFELCCNCMHLRASRVLPTFRPSNIVRPLPLLKSFTSD